MKIKTIDINAKEWFDKVNGNSYFAGVITIDYGTNTQKEIVIPMQYGYGDHYVTVATDLLVKGGVIADQKHLSLWRYCNDNNIILRKIKEEKCLLKELKAIK